VSDATGTNFSAAFSAAEHGRKMNFSLVPPSENHRKETPRTVSGSKYWGLGRTRPKIKFGLVQPWENHEKTMGKKHQDI
jgi:hypothetical protein